MTEHLPSVLVVDDDPADLRAVERTLSDIRLRVLTLREPQQVTAEVRAERPDLVILDALLPGLSGFDLCRQIKTSSEGKPPLVVILTGVYLREHYRHEAVHQFKADAFVAKPVRPKDLQRLALKLLAKKLKTTSKKLERELGLTENGRVPRAPEEAKPGWLGRLLGKRKDRALESLREGLPHTASGTVDTSPPVTGASVEEPPRASEVVDEHGQPVAESRLETQEATERQPTVAPAHSEPGLASPPPPGHQEEGPAEPSAVAAAEAPPTPGGEPTRAAHPKEVAEPGARGSTERPDETAPSQPPARPSEAEAQQGATEPRTRMDTSPQEEAREDGAIFQPQRADDVAVASTESAVEEGGERKDKVPAARTHPLITRRFAKSVPTAQKPARSPHPPAPAKKPAPAERPSTTSLRRLRSLKPDLPIYPEADFRTEFKRELAICKRLGRPLTLVLIRVADLGQIIELLGRDFRSPVLFHVAEHAIETVREVDMATVIVSEDLIALAAFASDRYGGERVISRLGASLRGSPFSVGENMPSFLPAVRFGMATFPEDGGTLEELLGRATDDMSRM